MEDKKKSAPKVSRQKLVENSRANFYANLNQVYIENKNAPVLMPAPSTKQKPLPPKPTSGNFSRADAEEKRSKQPLKATMQRAPTAQTKTTKPRTSSINADLETK